MTDPAPSEIRVRAVREEDLETFAETNGSAFGFEWDADDWTNVTRLVQPNRMLCAFQGAAMVGVAGALQFSLAVPGGELPTAGVTLVGVRPSHRRRGVLTAMMRHQLDDVRAWGEPLAILWASESNIYHRFGYGLATLRATIDVEPDRATFRAPSLPFGRIRLIPLDEALRILPDLHERARAGSPGTFRRSPTWWTERRLADSARHRRGGGPMFRAALEVDGRAEGYALYRVHSSWGESGLPEGWLDVLEALGTTPLATREIWRFLFGVDLVARVRADRLRPDHPLLLTLAEPRRLRLRLLDGIWLRVVDVRAALGARAYADTGSLIFDLIDPFCPWNAGRWRLEAGPGGARLAPTADPPDLRLDASDLGAAYLGGVSFSQLVRAARVEELRPGAAHRADALFHTPIAPWCPDDF